VVVATAIAPLQIWVRGRRWWYLFPPGSNPPPLTPAMMIGYMANNVLPLRAGEVVRIYVVARRWSAAGPTARLHPFWTTLATLVVERVLDSLVVVLVLVLLVLIVPVPRFLEMAALVVLAIDVVGIGVLIALAATPDACVRLVARLVGRCGEPLRAGGEGLTHLFPTPARLAQADLAGLGMTGARTAALKSLALAVLEQRVDFSAAPADVTAALAALPGIGPWTAQYVALRALGEPDAFPHGDWVLRRMAAPPGAPPLGVRDAARSASEARSRSESWSVEACRS